MQLTKEAKVKILTLREQNFTLKKIADDVGVYHSTVSRLLKKHKISDIVDNKYKNIRPRVLNNEEKDPF